MRRVKCDGAYLICDLLRHALIRELPHAKCYGCETSAASAHLDELEKRILELIKQYLLFLGTSPVCVEQAELAYDLHSLFLFLTSDVNRTALRYVFELHKAAHKCIILRLSLAISRCPQSLTEGSRRTGAVTIHIRAVIFQQFKSLICIRLFVKFFYPAIFHMYPSLIYNWICISTLVLYNFSRQILSNYICF